MNQRQFDQEIRRLIRRLTLLRAARRGDVQLTAVEVKAHVVRRHERAGHIRYVGPRR